MEFNVEIVLPSGRKCRIEELTNREYLSIIKFAQNKDLVGISRFFDELFIEPDMNIFDRFYLLIYVRMLFIEGSMSLNIEDKQVEVQLAAVLDKLEANYVDLETRFKEGGIEVTLDLPCITYYENIDDLFIATIKQVSIGDDILVFNTLSKDEQIQIMDNLPASMFKHIKKFIQTIQDNLLDLAIIDENKSIGLEKISINIIGNGVMQFITNIFSTDLNSFYTLIYMFQNTILPGSNLFFELSPIESRIILNAHSKRVKDENDKLQKQNNG
ncbi:MAG: gp26 family baseplate hub assembly chaperone [Deltaproteobacteria bacterium]|jgi:hypothetical protein|nr:gp26 family baseplate hub assembly chaperone [Deltaproteobacteria bacterium]